MSQHTDPTSPKPNPAAEAVTADHMGESALLLSPRRSYSEHLQAVEERNAVRKEAHLPPIDIAEAIELEVVKEWFAAKAAHHALRAECVNAAFARWRAKCGPEFGLRFRNGVAVRKQQFFAESVWVQCSADELFVEKLEAMGYWRPRCARPGTLNHAEQQRYLPVGRRGG